MKPARYIALPPTTSPNKEKPLNAHVICTSLMSQMSFFLCLQTFIYEPQILSQVTLLHGHLLLLPTLDVLSVSLGVPVTWFLCFFVTFITAPKSQLASATGCFQVSHLPLQLPLQWPLQKSVLSHASSSVSHPAATLRGRAPRVFLSD